MASGFQFPRLPEGILVGPFTLGPVISGEGAMSRIYKAYAKNQKRTYPVALKIARSDDEVFDKLLRTETKMLNDLRHPGIVHIYPINLGGKIIHVGRARRIERYFNGSPPWYFAMEVLDGGSLENHAQKLHKFPIEWKLELIYQVAITLDYLHRMGIAHRDLKMANVVLRTPPAPDRRPDPVLIDFGIAAQYQMRPMERTGTLSYLSPERVEEIMRVRPEHYVTTANRTINHLPSDVWALGIIAYEILMNQYPFLPFKREEELAYNIQNMKTPCMTKKIAPEVEIIVHRMLAKIREDRPTMADVIYMLDTETPYLPPRILQSN